MKDSLSSYKLLFWKDSLDYLEKNISKAMKDMGMAIEKFEKGSYTDNLTINLEMYHKGQDIFYYFFFSIIIDERRGIIEIDWSDEEGQKNMQYYQIKHASDEDTDYLTGEQILEYCKEAYSGTLK
jgi:hypothetical protein